MLSNRLVIGLDYGTTYTGIAFCETSDNEALEKHIEVVSDWPSRNSMIATTEKVPSEIAYTLEEIHWGSMIPAGVQRHMWTKLDLDQANQRTKGGAAGQILHENSQGITRMPVDIVADFLRKAKDHLIKTLDTQFGPELWRTLPITLVVTVPAVWSDTAKALTLRAIDMAGFNVRELPKLKRVITTTEPEAAALHTIKSFSGSVQNEQFAVGDGFIVCDMGGGTVDQISYRISGLQPTVLEEATIGNGAQCGGSFVDWALVRFLERRLGIEDFIKIAGSRSEDLQRTQLPVKLSKMLRVFIHDAKTGFSGKEVNFLPLPRPLSSYDDDYARGIVEGELMITVEDMAEMFSEPLAEIYELLLDQISQARKNNSVKLKYIFMVGGFSTSPFMYNQIKAFGESQGLQVIRPAFAWSAVVRGATVKGLEGDTRQRIQNRKCRRSYGVNITYPFVDGKHRLTDKIWNKYVGSWYAKNQMDWLVSKGQDLSTSSTCHGKHYLVCRFYEHEKRDLSLDFMASDLDKAPYRSKHDGVYVVATLDVSLKNVPLGLFKTKYNPHGTRYYEIDFNVEVSVQSVLEFSVSINGQRYGSVAAKYI